MTEQNKTLLVHALCVLIIGGCCVIAGTVLKGQPLLAGCVVGLGAWLWGKLGFKPAQVILDRIVVQQLGVTLEQAKSLTARPPAPAADDEVTQ
jgi:hypothetical protein